jgi:hypothetical protein
MISQLDHRYATEVEDVITSPPQQDPYTKLRTELLKRLSLSREQHAQQLLTFEEMGDRKPSQFLGHLRGLSPVVLDYLLRTIWTNRLPTKVRTTLTCHPKIELENTTFRKLDPFPSSGEGKREGSQYSPINPMHLFSWTATLMWWEGLCLFDVKKADQRQSEIK